VVGIGSVVLVGERRSQRSDRLSERGKSRQTGVTQASAVK
jgi:hypothetical protein